MVFNYRVMIVDDVPHNVEILETALEGKYTLASANSGEQALELLPIFRPDLILLDIMMPGISGYEVCRKIKADERLDFIKIILVTGKAMVEERLKGYEVGADDYVTKPFVIKELEAKIKVFLNLKQSKEIDKLKTDLLVLFSHETRTPLNGIIGGSELLLMDESLSESARKTAQLIYDSGNRLFEFVEKTMFLCELKGQPVLNKQNLLVQNRVLRLIDSFAETASKREIKFDLNLDETASLNADWGMLEKALGYLIENAVKYSDSRCLIKIEQSIADNSMIFRITDHGVGIDLEWQDKIFEEFVARDMIHHQKGQGLSLSIVKHVAELHGGSVKVESEQNNGTTFVLSLPFSR